MASAAVNQQLSVRNAFESTSSAITTLSYTNNATWPLYTVPFFESLSANFFNQTRAELLSFFPKVERDQRMAWEEYSARNYQDWVKQGHLMRYGDLSHLDGNTSKFHPYISMKSPTGLVPDVVKDEYFVSWCNSPPPMNYGMINWDVTSIPDSEEAIQAALTLKNQVVGSRVRPYSMCTMRDHRLLFRHSIFRTLILI